MQNKLIQSKWIFTAIFLLAFAFNALFSNPLPIEASTVSNKAGARTVELAENSKYQTELFIIESGKPGPVVLIVGGIHGSETAGYTAAARVSEWKIAKGTLLVIPRANQLAIARNVRYLQSEGDLNRSFPQSSKGDPNQVLSRAIWAVIKEYQVDWLMDMHEGIDYAKRSSSVGQSLIYYPNRVTESMARKIVNNLNSNISTSYKKFSLLEYPVQGSLARAAGQYPGVKSFIFETCDDPALSVRVNYQLKAARTLLQELDML